MRPPTATLLAAACALAGAQTAAAAPIEPWDGSKPFRCKIQDVGSTTDFPRPQADPFCVRFDKTGQNLSEGGLVTFLLAEPARVAAAAPKCRYYQRDHWRGSVVQEDGSTELYEFRGRYYFDKGRAAGGVFIKDFELGGRRADPSELDGFPDAFDPYFDRGGGGARLDLGLEQSSYCPA